MEPFRPFVARMVYRAIKFPTCSKTVPASYGWEWMTGYIYSKMGVSVGSPNHVTGPLGWVLLLPGTSAGTFGRSAQANRENLCVSAIFACRRSFLNQSFPLDIVSLPTQTEEFG